MKKNTTLILGLAVLLLVFVMVLDGCSSTPKVSGSNTAIRSLLIKNSTGIDVYFFFLRQTGDSNEWSEELLDLAKVYIIDAGDIENISLKNLLIVLINMT